MKLNCFSYALLHILLIVWNYSYSLMSMKSLTHPSYRATAGREFHPIF